MATCTTRAAASHSIFEFLQGVLGVMGEVGRIGSRIGIHSRVMQ